MCVQVCICMYLYIEVQNVEGVRSPCVFVYTVVTSGKQEPLVEKCVCTSHICMGTYTAVKCVCVKMCKCMNKHKVLKQLSM